MIAASVATVAICLAATAGVLARPWRLAEAVWPCAGAVLLVVLGLLPLRDAGAAVAAGGDVYLFLTGMMLLAEMARREGLFDWLAVHAVRWARGSPARLFALTYAIGVVVTAFLSNDATAVVLTPAVFAAARKAEADPLPALFACALVANAASFVLPISNPANLVLYGGAVPPLGAWLAAFALPSVLAIGATFAALRWTMRARLTGACRVDVAEARLGLGAGVALGGIVATAAGLLVAALERLGLIGTLAALVRPGAGGAAMLGGGVALASNAINNLPAGLIASGVLTHAAAGPLVTDAALIGVDLGPNLSITGSLATILWLAAIRREGEDVSFRSFLTVGAAAMPPALVLALGARVMMG